MKKFLSIMMILFTVSAGLVFADDIDDPFDKLAEKLMKDFPEENGTLAVKVFNSYLNTSEKRKVSKSVQFALYCTDIIEIVPKVDDADYVCTGSIEEDGPNYIVSAKITDNYDGSVVAKAKQKVPKSYYKEEADVKVETVVVENDIDAEDVLGAVIVGSVIGGAFHAITAPHYHYHPAPRPRRRRP